MGKKLVFALLALLICNSTAFAQTANIIHEIHGTVQLPQSVTYPIKGGFMRSIETVTEGKLPAGYLVSPVAKLCWKDRNNSTHCFSSVFVDRSGEFILRISAADEIQASTLAIPDAIEIWFEMKHQKLRGNILSSLQRNRLTTTTLQFTYNPIPTPEGYGTVKPTQGIQKLLTIIWDPNTGNEPLLTPENMQPILFGEHESVADYFKVQSLGKLTLQNAGIFKMDALFPYEDYLAISAARRGLPRDQWCSTEIAQRTGWFGGHSKKWAEAISRMDNQINFASFDTNHNRILEPQELAILLIIPKNGEHDGGVVRGVDGIQCPERRALVLDGIAMTDIAEWAFSNDYPRDYSTAMHELSHLFLKTYDMYNMPYWGDPGYLTLMGDNHSRTAHLDPLNKLALGWSNVRYFQTNSNYSLHSAGDTGEILILPRLDGATGEYFVVEYRQNTFHDNDPTYRGRAYDALSSYEQETLVVWHMVEDTELNSIIAPDCQIMDWQQKNIFRRAVRLIRKHRFSNMHPAYWVTGDTIHSNPENEDDGRLTWSDGSPSGYTIQVNSISPSSNQNLGVAALTIMHDSLVNDHVVQIQQQNPVAQIGEIVAPHIQVNFPKQPPATPAKEPEKPGKLEKPAASAPDHINPWPQPAQQKPFTPQAQPQEDNEDEEEIAEAVVAEAPAQQPQVAPPQGQGVAPATPAAIPAQAPIVPKLIIETYEEEVKEPVAQNEGISEDENYEDYEEIVPPDPEAAEKLEETSTEQTQQTAPELPDEIVASSGGCQLASNSAAASPSATSVAFALACVLLRRVRGKLRVRVARCRLR